MALEKQVFPTPLGKHVGGGGKMEPFPPWDFPVSKESHPALWDMHRGGGQLSTPRTSARRCLSLKPAGVAGAGSGVQHPTLGAAVPGVEAGWGGAGLREPAPPFQGAGTPMGMPGGPRCRATASSCSNLLVTAACLGFQGLQIKSAAALLLLGKGDGLCGKGWPSCCSPNACWGPRELP